jgi:XTP/dITP diphosphohydrolase
MASPAPRRQLVLATHNEDKLIEIRRLLADIGWEVRGLAELGLHDAPEEDADSFVGNAGIKALAAHRATGLPVVADDSGLVVDALGGAPGVHSSRFAGRAGDHAANNRLLLERLADVEDAARTARFVTVVAFAWGDEAPAALSSAPEAAKILGVPGALFRGVLEGSIARAPRGDKGFGYDPLFIPYGDSRHLAEYDLDEKNAVSHRGRAFAEFARFLARLDGDGVST